MNQYFQKLKDPQWQKKRLEILGRDSFKCRLCGDEKSTLHVHHLFYTKGADPWDYPSSSLVTLCEACHEELHAVRFGESILESLIVGGANLSALFGVMTTFQVQFQDGPNAAQLPVDRWDDAVGAITYALMAVQRGASETQIREALDGLAR